MYFNLKSLIAYHITNIHYSKFGCLLILPVEVLIKSAPAYIANIDASLIKLKSFKAATSKMTFKWVYPQICFKYVTYWKTDILFPDKNYPTGITISIYVAPFFIAKDVYNPLTSK